VISANARSPFFSLSLYLLLLFKFKILIKEQENLIYFYIFLLKHLSNGMFSIEEEEEE